MTEAGVSYKQLAKLLNADDPGRDYTPTSLTTLVNRGTFSLEFALCVFRVLKIRQLDLNRVVDEQPGEEKVLPGER